MRFTIIKKLDYIIKQHDTLVDRLSLDVVVVAVNSSVEQYSVASPSPRWTEVGVSRGLCYKCLLQVFLSRMCNHDWLNFHWHSIFVYMRWWRERLYGIKD